MTNNSKPKQFIITSSEEQRKILTNLGFQEIPSGSPFFMFINNATLKFSDNVDMDKIKFTDILCV